MGNEEFLKACKKILAKYINEHLDHTDGMKIDELTICPVIDESTIYPVWLTKVLQNNKGLFSTYSPDGMYYEITFNGNDGEFYLDAYKKFQNMAIKESDIA